MRTWYSSPPARDWTGTAVESAARSFHESLPGYAPTPLTDLPDLAAELGVGRVLVKDESQRLGLPAFKMLGAAWAAHQVLERSPGAMLVAATDGNHGRAVARTAAQHGVAATVFVPEFLIPETVALIESEGARVLRTAGDHTDAVERAAAFADEAPGRELLQDTAFDGYEQVPAWIVEGYLTLTEEIDAALGREPDLVAVPVGVGTLAEAVVRYYRRPESSHPVVLSVEPDTASCVIESLAAGERREVATGETVMAGMNCRTVSAASWPVLRDGVDAAVTVSDADALAAVDDLAERNVSAGPCGASTLAAARAVLGAPARRADLDLGPDAVIVLLSTEENRDFRPAG